ncbi:MAG: hypothetical protein J6W24_07520 [Prevotella sp.]|nr:hypothetical protein [Prevotella sp.]
MKNKYSILLMSLALTMGAWAQNTSELIGIPSGASVTADGSAVAVANNKATINVGATVKITPATGKTIKVNSAVQKAETEQGINLVGSQAIALAYKASDKGSSQNSLNVAFADDKKVTIEGGIDRLPMYNMFTEGDLTEMDWKLDFTEYKSNLDDNQKTTVDILAKYFVIEVKRIFKISDNWMWVWDVRGEVNPDEITQEEMQTVAGFASTTTDDMEGLFAYVKPLLQGMNQVADIKSNYLLRISDGSMFPWENAPAYQGDMTGSKIKMNGNYCDDNSINGFVEPFGDGIVYLNLQDEVMMVEVVEGKLQERQLSPKGKQALFVAPTAKGDKIVTVLIDEVYTDNDDAAFNGAGTAVLLDAQGNQENLGDWYRKDNNPERNGMEIFVINGNPYYFTKDNFSDYKDQTVSFYKVETEGDAVGVGDEIFTTSYSQYNLGRVVNSDYVFENKEGDKMSWINHEYAFTFDAAAKGLGVRKLPEHYSSGYWDYINDVAYTVDGEESQSREFPGKILTELPMAYYICDLKADAAIEKKIDWSGLSDEEKAFTDASLTWRYWPGTKNFISHATLQDGTSVSYSISTAEDSEGVASILGKGSGLVVVTTTAIK